MSNHGQVNAAWSAATDDQWARFRRTGRISDLDKAIELSRAALDAVLLVDPDRAKYLSNLGAALSSRHQLTGDSADLDEAIEFFGAAVAVASKRPIELVMYVANLGAALHRRLRDEMRKRPQVANSIKKIYAWLLDARSRTLGPEHPDTLESAKNLSLLIQEVGIVGKGVDRMQLQGLTIPDGKSWGEFVQLQASLRSTRSLENLAEFLAESLTPSLENTSTSADEESTSSVNVYTHRSSKGVTYYLHSKLVVLRGGKEVRIYFFSKDLRDRDAVSALPENYEVAENPRNGFLTIRKASKVV